MAVKVAVLASGGGSNFENLVDHSDEIGIAVQVLITDHSDAYAVKRAEKFGIPAHAFERRKFDSKMAHEQAILEILYEYEVEYVLLAGYMRILSRNFIHAFEHHIINLHPSLLPSFKGRNGIEDAFNYGVKVTGVTIHFVDAGIDTGEIIAQEPIIIGENDTLEMLETKIHRLEYELYPKALKKVIEGVE
ncbi:phosphoribosylglycinamide formyltransferase [Salinicoccus halodurans]|uniref:Phosphoribosylglycinamide formyltransferase n=1 Tax=Salinicoccus halodurans TaxID=407035 RepID=A0A0F7D453_9STAP|nr:phosphoribosylglycinamide formyltransferase [Salinicoccus halodurans]AKG73635.1 phosphoribosylglycinamide formyltransferase [Salinicoccus halodurans]SFK53665.1 phosphoribosylglycinamide formyltransferase-1 [Salinicoccus halodurans]